MVALSAAGCAGRACPTQPFHEAQNALSAYRDMRRPARVIRAEARVDRRDREGRIRGTVRMIIQRPDRVRFDAMTQFGPAATLTSDGAFFALTDKRENVFLEGPTCPANIERLLGLRFAASEVTRLLLGESPRIEAQSESLACHGGTYRMTRVARDGSRQEIDLEVRPADLEGPPAEQRLRLRRSEVFGPDGATRWRVTYGDYRFLEDPADAEEPKRGVVLPFTVRFEDPRRGVDTLVSFRWIELNPVDRPVRPEDFTQRPDPGLTRRTVPCD
ncbi:MAG: hypothetical protein ACFCGT_02455 [Sandaracinaceae bacterium]